MTLTDVSLKNLKRRRVRTALLVLSLMLAVSLLVGISSAVQSMQSDLGRKMDEYGANIVIMPRMLESPVSYGGIAVGGAVPQFGDLEESDTPIIRTIRNKENLNVIAPKLLGQVNVAGQSVGVMGVLFEEELRMKQWWELNGRTPAATSEVILGQRVAANLGAMVGSTISIEDPGLDISSNPGDGANGRQFEVVAVLGELGGPEDDYVFADLHVVQSDR
jgi:putative ABC transport system permease protein